MREDSYEIQRQNLLNKEKDELVDIILLRNQGEERCTRCQTLIRKNNALKESLRNQQDNLQKALKWRDDRIKKLQAKICELKVAMIPGRTLEMVRSQKKVKIKLRKPKQTAGSSAENS